MTYSQFWLSLFVGILAISSCRQKKGASKQNDSTQQIATKRLDTTIDITNLLQSGKFSPQAVHIKYDHYFKTPKTFQGYSLKILLDSIINSINFDTTDAIVIFECKDGYKPLMELSKINGHANGYIAFKDLDHKGTGNWDDSLQKMFNPYYLAWDDVPNTDDSFAWPYGLVAIKLTSITSVYKDIYPSKDLALIKGFNLYRINCMKCHSMNKVGGTMGLEFNIPKNITEYWKEKDIIAFAKNPTAFRKNSPMPGITHLSEDEFREIVAYINYMKDFKIEH